MAMTISTNRDKELMIAHISAKTRETSRFLVFKNIFVRSSHLFIKRDYKIHAGLNALLTTFNFHITNPIPEAANALGPVAN